MRRRPGGLDAAALVHTDVHDHRAAAHLRKQLAADQHRRAPAGDQHRPDHQVRHLRVIGDGVRIAVDGADVGRHHVVEVAQAVEVHIHKDDAGADAGRHLGRVGSHHAAAEDQHVGRLDARHAAEQNAPAHHGFFQILRAFLHAHAAGDLAHRRQQRQPALLVGQRLVGDGRDLRPQAGVGQFTAGGEVKVGEDHLPRPQHVEFRPQRFLDFHDQLAALEQGRMVADDLRARGRVLLVHEAAARAGVALDQHAVAGLRQKLHAHGQHRHAVFIGLGFARNGDDHGGIPFGRVRESIALPRIAAEHCRFSDGARRSRRRCARDGSSTVR